MKLSINIKAREEMRKRKGEEKIKDNKNK